MERNLVRILGYGVDTFSMEEAADYISAVKGQIVTINPEMIDCANNNKDFASIINDSSMVVPDGIGVEIGLKILGAKVKRIAGIDLGKSLIKRAYLNNQKIAFIGAQAQIVEKAVQNLKNEFDGLNVVYVHDGYFDNEDTIMFEVINANPDLVLVALGSPKQEFFINKLKKSLPNSVFIGLGGSFDVWSGVVKRAPVIYQKLGLEWLYRTICQPSRIKRIFPVLPLFLLNVIIERLSKR